MAWARAEALRTEGDLHTTAALFDSLQAAWWLVALLVVVVLAAAWWARRRGSRGHLRHSPAVDAVDTLTGWAPQATRVLTLAELRAYSLLAQALPRHMILAQVSLARFVKVPTRNSYAEWLRRVGHLSGDLLVCSLHSQVLAVVEVRPARERSDERAGRRRQRFARVLKAVGIPLHVWVENALPTVDEVRQLFAPKPALVPGEAPATAPRAVAGAVAGNGVGQVPLSNTVFERTQQPPADEVIEMREPPSSTWFDDFDSGVAPLDPPRGGRR